MISPFFIKTFVLVPAPLILLLFPYGDRRLLHRHAYRFFQDIPAPRKGTLGQHPPDDPFATTAFSPTSQAAPFAPSDTSPMDEPFRWFLPYTMLISDSLPSLTLWRPYTE
ncbi:hypothetical protein Hanom_Chr11g01016311 [Helianthus anomalus]